MSEKSADHVTYKPVRVPERTTLPVLGTRHCQVALLFWMVFTALGFNVILSVTIVAMTDQDGTRNHSDIPVYKTNNKGIILSAFFWGYIWPQPIAGYTAARFGAKWIIISAMAAQCILGSLMPLTAAYLGSVGLCFSRAFQGFCQGFLFPSLTQQLSQWVPKEERSRLGAFAFGGVPLGIVSGMLLAGIISASQYGWPWVFYLYGLLSGTWCIFYAFLGFDSPAVHPSISPAERAYIETSLGKNDRKSNLNVPWRKIFKSAPAWALLAAQTGYIYCTSTFLSQIPSYLRNVMGYQLGYNGMLSAFPFFMLWIFSFIFSYSSDYLINHGYLTVGAARKTFNSIGLVTSAVCLVALGLTSRDNHQQAAILLVGAVASLASCMSGWSINHIDLSPRHAGTLMGLTNGAAHISAVISPLMVQLFVTDQRDANQWRMIFFLAAGVATLATVVFVIFGSGEVQTWNETKRKRSNEEGFILKNLN